MLTWTYKLKDNYKFLMTKDKKKKPKELKNLFKMIQEKYYTVSKII